MAKLGSFASYCNAQRRWTLLGCTRTKRTRQVALFPLGGRASQPDQCADNQRQGYSSAKVE
ncbi:MAG: hypothetical protein IJR26_02835 [Bacteroidales bacterium]|nr:hypothetical protein [Bacteroidales bacterium]